MTASWMILAPRVQDLGGAQIGPALGPLRPEASLWFEYQDLVGSAIGVFGAFLAALVAFGLSKWGERQDAAYTVYFELELYKTAVAAFLDEVEEPPIPQRPEDADRPGAFEYVRAVERLRMARPAFSPAFETATGRLYSADPLLAVHLQTFRASASAAERVFRVLEDAETRKVSGQEVGYTKAGLFALIRSAGGLAQGAANQAGEAIKILGQTYIERYAWFHRWKRWWRRRALPGEYLRALKGELTAPGSDERADPQDHER